MVVKLIQNGIVDSADDISRLDCNSLSAHAPWSVTVDFGSGDVCVADVNWAIHAGYAMRLVYDGCGGLHCSRLSHHCIVPGVLGLLSELFESCIISSKYQIQPMVQVAPIG